jgi:hypothetical protein
VLRNVLLATFLVFATTPVLYAKERILLYRIGPSESTLFIANADGSDERPLLPNSGFDYNASFSADGKWIIFTSERGGSADIYRAHPDGSGLERLTDDPAYDDQGALSPDGKQLAFVSSRGTGSADIWVRQGAEDWEAFLSLRACEMRPGARLVVVLPGLSDNGSSGFGEVMDHANAVLAQMVDEGTITAQERARMLLETYPRRKSELLAPFAKEGQFQRLFVEDCEMSVLPDAAWADYQLDGDEEALATKQALFFRSVFMPSLASALTRVRDGDSEGLRSFADRLQDGLTRRLASQPASTDSFVETIVLAKYG